MKKRISSIITAGAVMLIVACQPSGSSKATSPDSGADMVEQAKFDSDSAYAYVARQVAMGPRVSGTRANESCCEYIKNELKRHGADSVRVQRAKVTAYNGDELPIGNVMGAFNPSAKERILLLAHYDSRPWADSDPDSENHTKPVPGANDGASGVGVMLEIARQLSMKTPRVGVDMLFVDAEDYGQSSGFSNQDETWALGTQYWAEHMPYAQDSLPEYGILFDMVGGPGAKFHREYLSNEAAPNIVDKVWGIAARSGFADRFPNVLGGAVVDDHVYINKVGIPCVNIIESKNDETKTFPATWHTLKDDMDNIDKATLNAAGQTVLNVIYAE